MPVKAGSYVPTLAIRASEMNGLEYLPGLTKDKLTPVFLLAPWSTSKTLAKAIERVERAFPRRPYFLDVDRDYYPSNPESPAQAEWLALRNPADRFDAWWQFWTDFPNAIPCLQLEGQDKSDIKLQIGDIQSQGREFAVRIELSRRPRNIGLIVEALQEVGTADFTVILEGGWTSNPLLMFAQFHGLISGILAPLDGRIPMVVSCTSMPKEYHEMSGISSVPFTNHDLLQQLRNSTNRETIIYGDWGSTKPREEGFGRTPLPRIDYPTADAWLIARDKDAGWSFTDAANAIVHSGAWTGDLGIWGEQMIELTTQNEQFAIDTPQKNVAARVNIHLHRQALYGQQIAGLNLDEPWVD